MPSEMQQLDFCSPERFLSNLRVFSQFGESETIEEEIDDKDAQSPVKVQPRQVAMTKAKYLDHTERTEPQLLFGASYAGSEHSSCNSGSVHD